MILIILQLEKKIGVDYPWDVYRQAPVRDFLYAGMENTTFTLMYIHCLLSLNLHLYKILVRIQQGIILQNGIAS